VSTPAITPPATSKPLSNFRVLAPWYTIDLLNSYSATLLTAGCYDYADKVLHASPSTSLWLSAFWGLAYIFISLNAGRISERLGPRRVLGIMISATILSSLLGISSILIPFVFMLFAVMLPFNISSSTIWPALESAITRTQARTPLSTRIALYNFSWGATGFIALFTCGALEKLWWGNIFLVPALCSALSLSVFHFFAAPESLISKDHVPEESATEHDLDTPDLRTRAKRLLLMAWIGNTFAYVAINVLLPVKAALATEAGLTNLTAIGIITSVWGFTRCAGFFITWKWSGWHYKTSWLLAAQFTLAITFFLMLILHNPLILILTQILFGLATALIYSSSLYYAMHVSDGHGGHAGLHEALIGVGIAVGPAIGALAGAGELGPAALLRIALAVTLLLLLGATAMTLLAPPKLNSNPTAPLGANNVAS
jgi:MFS family permease